MAWEKDRDFPGAIHAAALQHVIPNYHTARLPTGSRRSKSKFSIPLVRCGRAQTILHLFNNVFFRPIQLLLSNPRMFIA